MLPSIWIFDTYSIMLLIGVASCLFVYYKYSKKKGLKEDYIYSILLVATVSVIIGLVFASLFQILFNKLKGIDFDGSFPMTFFGGLVGGVIAFILIYVFYIKRKYKDSNFIKDVLIIAPGCITLAHGCGRIGCFLAGCCYGIETTSWLGVTFPGMTYKVLPTQLFEATFLFVLSAILIMLAFKIDCIFNMSIYLCSYGVFRYFIELIRGDDRGAFFLNLSPSQWFSIIAIITSMVLFVILFKKNYLDVKKEEVK